MISVLSRDRYIISHFHIHEIHVNIHFQGHFGLTTVEELELAIQNCKQLVLQTPPGSDRMKNLVRKLVQLRLKRSEALVSMNKSSVIL